MLSWTLALALDLARRDVPFILIERDRGPLRGSRGKGPRPCSRCSTTNIGTVYPTIGRLGLVDSGQTSSGDNPHEADIPKAFLRQSACAHDSTDAA